MPTLIMIRRAHEDQIKRASRDFKVLRHVGLYNPRPVEKLQTGQVLTNYAEAIGISIHKSHKRRAARQSLNSDGSGSRIEIQKSASLDPERQDVKKRLFNAAENRPYALRGGRTLDGTP